jgi:hypothetical protein
MALSKKPRHWISLIIAIAAFAISLIQVFDFTGEAPPRWRATANSLLIPVVILLLVWNMVLDKDEKK